MTWQRGNNNESNEAIRLRAHETVGTFHERQRLQFIIERRKRLGGARNPENSAQLTRVCACQSVCVGERSTW